MAKLGVAVIATTVLLLASRAHAGIAYDFSWEFPPYSGSGTLVLSDSIGVGQSFDIDDFELIDIDLFDGEDFVTGMTSPPDALDPSALIDGTRNASSLSLEDILIAGPGFTGLFGCRNNNCFTGLVAFPGVAGNLDFGSGEAAIASFVLTEAPEPGAASATLGALLAIASIAGARAHRR